MCKRCGLIRFNLELLRKYKPSFPVDFVALRTRYYQDREVEINQLVREGKFNKGLAKTLLEQ